MFKPVLLSSFLLTVATASLQIFISQKNPPTGKFSGQYRDCTVAHSIYPKQHELTRIWSRNYRLGNISRWCGSPFFNITQADVETMKQEGLTLEMSQTWQNFYENETLRNPGNPTAPFRAQLMKKSPAFGKFPKFLTILIMKVID